MLANFKFAIIRHKLLELRTLFVTYIFVTRISN